MESPSISISGKNKSGAGFTLIEILLVIFLVSLIFAFTSAVGFDSLRRNYLKTEQSTLISILQKARNQAMNNINQVNHGVHYDEVGHKYIIFEGNTFIPGASGNQAIDGSASVDVDWPADIVFNQLSGNAATAVITITQDNASSTITTNYEGRINW